MKTIYCIAIETKADQGTVGGSDWFHTREDADKQFALYTADEDKFTKPPATLYNLFELQVDEALTYGAITDLVQEAADDMDYLVLDTNGIMPLPIANALDLTRLVDCHPGVRLRRLVEMAIFRRTCEALVAAGYTVSVNDGEETVLKRSTDVDQMMAVAFTTDDELLYVHEKDKSTGRIGYVRFIYGNTGWDVMSDYTVNLEEALKPANRYAEQMSEWF